MGEDSKIEWTDHTFNPWMGCTKVSPGCKHCYAERDMDHHWKKVQWGPGNPRVRTSAANWKTPIQWNKAAEAAGTRTRVFCASLADWLDPEVPVTWLADLLDLVAATPHLDWLLLTKRPELWEERIDDALFDARDRDLGCARMLHFWINGCAPKNVWIGWTAESQKYLKERTPEALDIPAPVHFVSAEPLLGGLDFSRVELNRIDWVIAGGESGPNARPMHPDWVRGIRDQCVQAGVPFLFKQWGEWSPLSDAKAPVMNLEKAGCDASALMWRVGKKNAGRVLDGRTWDELPEVAKW